MKAMNTLFLYIAAWCFAACAGPSSYQAPEQTEVVNPLAYPAQLHSQRGPLMRSDDFGETWENAAPSIPKEEQVSFLQELGKEIVLATDNMGLFVSSNK